MVWTSLYYDWDWAAAERYVRKALELNPGYAQAHHYYRDVCMVLGRWDEAIAGIYEARKYDPIEFQDTHYLATTLILARRYDEALKETERRLKLNPDDGGALWNLRSVYMRKGEYNKMADITPKMVSSPNYPILLYHFYTGSVHALLGNHDEAQKHLLFLEEYYYRHSAGETLIALLYMDLDDFDKVFE